MIPAGAAAGQVLTMWTQDFSRTGTGFANTPTVPVAHLNVTGSGPAYSLANGAALRASIAGAEIETLGAATASLLDPATFSPPNLYGQPGVQLTSTGSSLGVNGVIARTISLATTRDSARGLGALCRRDRRHARIDGQQHDRAHHPFTYTASRFNRSTDQGGWSKLHVHVPEFRDNIDVPANYTLRSACGSTTAR